jgi:DNA-binding response OmpR family regulator
MTMRPTDKVVVLVEDDETSAMMTAMTLAEHDVPTTVLRNAAEAFAFDGWGEDVIAVVDWMLPDVSGADIAHWLRATHPEVDVIMFTAAPEAFRLREPDFPPEVRLASKARWPNDLFDALGGA